MTPDIFLEVRFKTTAEGGRLNNINGKYYGCPLFVDGEAFECRLFIQEEIIELGKTYELPTKFMNSELVLPKLALGKTVTFWEGREIGEGRITKLVSV